MAKSLRILFVSMEYPPETGFGGIGSYVACVARMLARRGHEVHVLSCAPGQVHGDNLDGEVLIHRRSRFHVRGLARLTRSRHASDRLDAALSCWREAICLSAKFDIVEVPDWMAEGLFIAVSRRWPLVGHLHGPLHIIMRANLVPMDYATWLGDRLERAAMHRVDLISCLAPHMSKDLVETNWIRGRPVRILPFPIDMDRWLGVAPVRATRPTVLVVGRVEPHKAQDLMVKAAGQLVPSVEGLELVFAGRYVESHHESSYKAMVEQLARHYSVRCRFLNHVSRNELPGWYGQARVVVVPSWYEGVSIAALEGMAAGRPVVCTNKVAAASLLQGTGAGAIVRAGDPAALARALLPYLRDPDAAAEAGGRAREAADAYSRPDTVALAYEEAYTEAIDRWHHRRTFASPAGKPERRQHGTTRIETLGPARSGDDIQ